MVQWVTMRSDLASAETAVTSVLSVLQFSRGTIFHKSKLRAAGNLIAATAALTLFGAFGQITPIFLTSIGLWLFFVIFVGGLGNQNNIYMFRNSGYTAMIVIKNIIGTNKIDAFGYALHRVLDIWTGIICALFVAEILLQPNFKKKLTVAYDTTLKELSSLTKRITNSYHKENEPFDRTSLRNLSPIISTLSKLENEIRSEHFFNHHEININREFIAAIYSLRERLSFLSFQMRNKHEHELRNSDSLQQHLDDFSNDISKALVDCKDKKLNEIKVYFEELENKYADTKGEFSSVNLVGIIKDLERLLSVKSDIISSKREYKDPPKRKVIHHISYSVLARRGFRSMAALAIASLVWYLTGIEKGGYLLTYSVLYTTLYGGENPKSMAIRNTLGMFLGIILGFIYSFYIIPHLNGFLMLAISQIPLIIILGLLKTTPWTNGMSTSCGVVTYNLLPITNLETYSLEYFMNIATAAAIAAFIIAFCLTCIFPEKSSVVKRSIFTKVYEDAIQELGKFSKNLHSFESIMSDRISQIWSNFPKGDQRFEMSREMFNISMIIKTYNELNIHFGSHPLEKCRVLIQQHFIDCKKKKIHHKTSQLELNAISATLNERLVEIKDSKERLAVELKSEYLVYLLKLLKNPSY